MPTIKKLYTSSGVAITAPTDLSIEGAVGLQSAVFDANNYAIAASVAANALTIAIKSAAGTDCTGADYASFGFRSATLTSGVYSVVTVTAALSMTVSSGSTLGSVSGQPAYHYIYAINNAGAIELGISSTKYDDGTVLSTTAEGGAGAADSATVVYSTTARSNVAIRVIGRIKSTQTTAGTWAAAISEISSTPILSRDGAGGSVTASTTNGYGSTNTKIRRFTTTTTVGTCLVGADSSTLGYTITVLESGTYCITYYDNFDAVSDAGISLNSTELTTNISGITFADRLASATVSRTAGDFGFMSVTRNFKLGDVIRAHGDGVTGSTARCFLRVEQLSRL